MTIQIEFERKYLVKSYSFPYDLKFSQSSIIQTYLGSEGTERVRLRLTNGEYEYIHTIKQHLGPGKNLETEKVISAKEYQNLLANTDPNRYSINKIRYTFEFENQTLELDVFYDVNSNTGKIKLILLEIELEDENTPAKLPDWINLVEEVTGLKEYSNGYLSLK